RQDRVGRRIGQLRRMTAHAFRIGGGEADVEPHVVSLAPTQFLELLLERPDVCRHLGIILPARNQQADAPHALALLRACRQRQCCRAAEQRYELAPPHSITSSAATSSLSGTVRPSIRAVSALMTSSSLLTCATGRSAGAAPLRMRPV